MVRGASDYRWSSAASHLTCKDDSGMLDMGWWRREPAADWQQVLNAESLESDSPASRGRHLCETAERFGRYWTRARPQKKQALARPVQQQTDQFTLF